MAVQPIQSHSLILVPPLDMPLSLRMEHGRFTSLRPKAIQEPSCTQHVMLPDVADTPDHVRIQLHYALDLNALPGDCVYAAYSGTVIEVQQTGNQGNITIDHHAAGLGYVTKYVHITDIQVAVDETVQQGQPIAAVADVLEFPHLHFSLWLVIDRDVFNQGRATDNEMVPIDPMRWLYRWEREFLDEVVPFGDSKVPQKIAVVQDNRMPFFQVVFDSPVQVSVQDLVPMVPPDSVDLPSLHIPVPYYIPLYEPADLDERLMVDMLRDAFLHQREVSIHYRQSAFFNRRIVSQVVVT